MLDMETKQFTKAELMRTDKDVLVQMAIDKGIDPSGMTAAKLADALIKQRAQELIDSAENELATPSATPAADNGKNIIFVGDGEPTLKIHGAFKAELPDAETQKAGFYHPQARQIIQLFPKSYKRYQRLGDI